MTQPPQPPTQPTGQPLELHIESILPNPHQPRKTMNQQALAELAASIAASGLIQPIVVRPTAGGYELVAGERRLRATKLAGMTTIPAFVKDVDPAAQAILSLIENIQREDLNPIERAAAYQTALKELGLTQAELAGRLGEDRSTVTNYLRLLDLPEPVKSMVRDGRLSMGHAKLIASVPDILSQERLANLVLSQGLSVRNLERVLEQGGNTPPPAALKPASLHIQELEKSIARQLGMRIQIRSGKKGKGRLTIHYTSLDQFDGLMEKLGIRVE